MQEIREWRVRNMVVRGTRPEKSWEIPEVTIHLVGSGPTTIKSDSRAAEFMAELNLAIEAARAFVF